LKPSLYLGFHIVWVEELKATSNHSDVLGIRCFMDGFARAFLKVGRRLLIDEAEFFRVVREKNNPFTTQTSKEKLGD
jgi:hypothetical protein